MGFCGDWCQGDDAGKAPALVTCDAVSAGEKRKKLMGAEGVETEPKALPKAWRRRQGERRQWELTGEAGVPGCRV